MGCFSFFFALNCSALSYSGLVTVEKARLALAANETKTKFILSATSLGIKSQLAKLKPGDYVSLEGFTSPDKTILYVGSVNYVGLKDLLGNWIGDDEYCYKFNDFSILSIYTKNDKKRCDFSINSLAREFSYFINPAHFGWSVLLSDNDDSYLMDLNLFTRSAAELSLYDSRSGDILRKVYIRR